MNKVDRTELQNSVGQNYKILITCYARMLIYNCFKLLYNLK